MREAGMRSKLRTDLLTGHIQKILLRRCAKRGNSRTKYVASEFRENKLSENFAKLRAKTK
jgi:hypothetical protein